MPRSSLRISPRTTGLLQAGGDGAEAGVDGVEIDERAKHPGAEHTGAHAGDGGIERGD